MIGSRARVMFVASVLVGAALSQGCGSSSSSGGDDPCASESVSRFQELEIVDESVVTDPRTRNADGGPWSFRYVVEQATPPGMKPSDFVRSWIEEWSVAGRVNETTIEPRPLVKAKLLCPWLQRTPENKCNQDCSTCAGNELDLTKAPFRTIGFAYRLDQRIPVTQSEAGEGRIIFGLMSGAADDPASTSMAMTLIFEFELVGPRQDWAQRWHALGKFQGFGDDYKNALQAVTDGFIRRGSKPGGPAGGSALSQVRSNEREFDWQWELREFELTDAGIRQRALANTPDQMLNMSDTLREWLVKNQDTVLKQEHVLPLSLRGGVIRQGFSWVVPSVPEDLRKAFAKQTCNGCHQTEAQPVDANFHVSPMLDRKGIDRLSPFLNNPADPTHDELSVRENLMRDALCGR